MLTTSAGAIVLPGALCTLPSFPDGVPCILSLFGDTLATVRAPLMLILGPLGFSPTSVPRLGGNYSKEASPDYATRDVISQESHSKSSLSDVLPLVKSGETWQLTEWHGINWPFHNSLCSHLVEWRQPPDVLRGESPPLCGHGQLCAPGLPSSFWAPW